METVHVYPLELKPHEISPTCWCEPELDTVTEDGGEVWVHRKMQ